VALKWSNAQLKNLTEEMTNLIPANHPDRDRIVKQIQQEPRTINKSDPDNLKVFKKALYYYTLQSVFSGV